MTKLKRDARAFAARIRMSSTRLWLLVEGRVHDRPYYDRLLASHDGLAGSYSVRLSESVELDGASAGGKEFALSLFEFFEAEDLLVQANNQGLRTLAIALDRDIDHLSKELTTSPHVFYTRSMDVESDILLHGDILRAAADAFSLTRERVSEVLSPAPALALDLADRWKDWITTGVCAMACGLPTEVAFSRTSRINEGGYGPLSTGEAAVLTRQVEIRAAAASCEVEYQRLREQVERIYDAGDQWTLVKGKWLAGFVWHLVHQATTGEARDARVQTETLAKTCLGTLSFHEQWAQPTLSQVSDLLALAPS